jgi:3-phosphoshikimate 1-carboxyvinyltransferase
VDYRVDVARAPVSGAFRVPGSKSHHQRALVLAALSDGPSEVVADAREAGDDVRDLAGALARLGAWTDGAVGTSRERVVVDLGRGATGLRFATAVAALRPRGARTLLRGHRTLRRRPHGPLLRAIERLGGHARRRPSGSVRVIGGGLHGGRLVLSAATSSQYASALLLVGPRIGGLEIALADRPVSAPYLRATLDVLEAFGVPSSAEGGDAPGATLAVSATAPRGTRYVVPPDASAAAAWWAAAALTGGEAWVEGLARTAPQADARLLPVLEAMGAQVEDRDGAAHVVGRPPLRSPGTVDLRDAPDLLPIVGALAAAAEGTTRIAGVAHARKKESDRVATVAAGLAALGVRVREEGDGVEVVGGGARGGVVAVAGDHRLAFAFGVLGLVVPGVVLRGAEAVRKSHPRFLRDLARAGGCAVPDE